MQAIDGPVTENSREGTLLQSLALEKVYTEAFSGSRQSIGKIAGGNFPMAISYQLISEGRFQAPKIFDTI